MDEFIEKKVKSRPKRSYDKSFVDPKIAILMVGIPFLAVIFIFLIFRYTKFEKNLRVSRPYALSVGVFWLVTTIHYFLRSEKYGQWDAWMIWNAHGKALNSLQLWSGPAIESLRHPDYPFFLSSIIALGYKNLPEPLWLAPTVFSLVLFMVFMAVLVGTIYKRSTAYFFYIILITLAVDGNFYLHASSQNADTLIGFVIFLCFAQVINSLKANSDYVLLGFLSASSVWIKNEGWAFFILFSTVMYFMERPSIRKLFLYFLGTLLPLVVCIHFKIHYAPSNDLIEGGIHTRLSDLFDWERHQVILNYYVQTLVGHYPQLLILSLAAFLTPLNKTSLWLAAVIIGLLFSYYAVYLLTPHDLVWHLSTSLNRLFHHIYPSALLILAVQFSDSNKAYITNRLAILTRRIPRRGRSAGSSV
jgi:hypothetical protein